jgi:hypothetical protein
MQNYKYIISLTTIPTKFDNIYFCINSLLKQNIKIEKIIIHIPKVYSFRFNNSSIPQEKINTFLQKYSKYNVHINLLDTDYGPGTKLLGLYHTDLIKFDDTLLNTYILIVDDDLIYKPHMIKYFDKKAKVHTDIQFASYYIYKLNNKYNIAQACSCFFIKPSSLNNFLDYYNEIKDMDYVNFHDDVYISYYFQLKNIPLFHLRPFRNHCIYIFTKITRLDALHKIEGKYSRDNLEQKMGELLDTFEESGKFAHLNPLFKDTLLQNTLLQNTLLQDTLSSS